MGPRSDYKGAVPKHNGTMSPSISNHNELKILAPPQSPFLRRVLNQTSHNVECQNFCANITRYDVIAMLVEKKTGFCRHHTISNEL